MDLGAWKVLNLFPDRPDCLQLSPITPVHYYCLSRDHRISISPLGWAVSLKSTVSYSSGSILIWVSSVSFTYCPGSAIRCPLFLRRTPFSVRTMYEFGLSLALTIFPLTRISVIYTLSFSFKGAKFPMSGVILLPLPFFTDAFFLDTSLCERNVPKRVGSISTVKRTFRENNSSVGENSLSNGVFLYASRPL